MKARYGALLVAMAIPALALDYLGCTVWDNAVVPNGGGGAGGSKTTSSSGSGGGGGSGGGNSDDLGGLVLVSEAIKICTMAQTSNPLTSSIVASLGLPIGRNNGEIAQIYSQSECLTWLAGKVAANREAYVPVQSKVLKAVASHYPNADAAASELAVHYLPFGDTRCKNLQPHCDGQYAYDCAKLTQSVIVDCNSTLFAPHSTCDDSGASPVCSTGLCTGTAGPACSGGDTYTVCDTKFGPKQSFQCSYTGTSCGSTFCQSPDDTTDTCTKLGDVTCSSGGALRLCDSKFYIDFDCDSILAGSSCANDGDQNIQNRCVFKGEECAPAGGGTIDSCNDGILTACITGKVVKVPCPGQTCSSSACGM